jgi:REP element-mobilizing transposase RayT
MAQHASLARQPLAYFLTFRTYGTWLPGDPRGSTPRWRKDPGTPLLRPHEGLRRAAEQQLVNAPVILDPRQRRVVHHTIVQVCDFRRWHLLVVNVRTNHVHVVLSGPGEPEPMMNALKSWSTRHLREQQLVPSGDRVWSRHGSTRYLWRTDAVAAACAYVQCQSRGNDQTGCAT